ncbi:alkaline phosphatase family protein [uncultured Alistipes sp.]|uniref:alkaline phosphatase family protein n=1 Tax=uncultured Alistipes sp. TaxID=538949 RepID=UPI00261098B8|nr:alkaline phosphatase family protein [uncultured Alistipes sp.]
MTRVRYILPLIMAAATLPAWSLARPKVVVQIVVSSMRAEDLNRYCENFGERGFRRLMEGGTYYPESHYDYLHTSTPASLATLTTGANPSVHGIIAARWIDYVTNKVVSLTEDRATMGLECDAGVGNCSPRNLVAPTLGESLQQTSPKSRVATVALDPTSAVVAGGYTRNVFWMDAPRGNWVTSSFYAETLPAWLRKYNLSREILGYIPFLWELKYPRDHYLNSRATAIEFNKPEQLRRKRRQNRAAEPMTDTSGPTIPSGIERMLYTPSGNALTLAFAQRVFTMMDLGKDSAPDLLTVCLDAPRRIAEYYGPESMEVEDMYYRLDEDLAQFLDYIYAQIDPADAMVILTSDHGTSPSYDGGVFERDRFNAAQFQVIINSFLSAQHGSGEWVIDYEDNNLYLNHTLIYNKGLDLAAIQNEAATFAMQFRGVSHALSSTAMRSSYFGSGYGEKMQNSFYPRRSGDVVINLMPGCIEERPNVRSKSGSMYGYDTTVPLLFYGGGIPARKIGRQVDMTAVAPTLAYLLNIPEPAASEGAVLEEFRE